MGFRYVEHRAASTIRCGTRMYRGASCHGISLTCTLKVGDATGQPSALISAGEDVENFRKKKQGKKREGKKPVPASWVSTNAHCCTSRIDCARRDSSWPHRQRPSAMHTRMQDRQIGALLMLFLP